MRIYELINLQLVLLGQCTMTPGNNCHARTSIAPQAARFTKQSVNNLEASIQHSSRLCQRSIQHHREKLSKQESVNRPKDLLLNTHLRVNGDNNGDLISVDELN